MFCAEVLTGRLHFGRKRGRCVVSCLKDEDRLTATSQWLLRASKRAPVIGLKSNIQSLKLFGTKALVQIQQREARACKRARAQP
jgi:hypothetical protein